MGERKHRGWRRAWMGAVFAGITTAAAAAPVTYQGTLTPGSAAAGQVSGSGWLDETAADVDFWRFVVPIGGLFVTITGTRGNEALDPVLTLYRGTTTADESAFLAEADWGGMSFLGTADDEIPNPGPGGDPLFTSSLLAAGAYTIAIGGFLSGGAGPYPYSVLLSVVPAAVPEPETLALSAAGLLALAFARRHRRHTGPQLAAAPA